MNSETTIGELYAFSPVVLFERNIEDIWRIKNNPHNYSRYGLFIKNGIFENNLLLHIYLDDHDVISRKLGAAILQSRPEIKLRYRIRTGESFRWVEEHCSLLYSDSGALIRAYSYIWFSNLPTEWALLSKGSEVWNTLNSKIRHDILNQLTAILGYLELSSDLLTDPMLIDFSKKEQNAAEKVRDRLIFTREYQKIGMYEFSWFSIEDLIRESLNEIVISPMDMIIQTDNAQIFVDKNFCLAMEKIIANIPEHAKGATEIKIRLIPCESGGLLIIEDNGCGIPEAQKKRIFDLGFGTGNGYGLFLTEKLLSVYGITIIENGIPEKGTRFELMIPSSILSVSFKNQ